MARVVDLTGENVTRQRRKERNFGTKTDLPSTSVERGNTHWTDGSNVNIDGFLGVAGTMTVSGVLSVTGTFNASGDINLSGSTSVTGPLDITGATTIGGSLDVTGPTTIDGVLTINGDTSIAGLLEVTGDTTISGTLDIEGNTTVASDFEIIAGGLFKSGVTKIEPTGKATFGTFIIDPSSNKLIQAPGGWLFTDGSDSIGLAGSNTSSVNLNSARAELVYASSSRVVARAGAIDLTAPATNVSGNLKVNGTTNLVGRVTLGERLAIPNITNAYSSAVVPNVYIDANGFLYRTTWTPA